MNWIPAGTLRGGAFFFGGGSLVLMRPTVPTFGGLCHRPSDTSGSRSRWRPKSGLSTSTQMVQPVEVGMERKTTFVQHPVRRMSSWNPDLLDGGQGAEHAIP